MKNCEMHVTHLRRYMVRHRLSPAQFSRVKCYYQVRISHFNNILLSIAKNIGCNVFDLLEIVRYRCWYDDGEDYILYLD